MRFGSSVRTLFARRPALSCQEMVELVTAYLEHALDAPTRRRFEAHLKTCEGCSTYLSELEATVATLGALTVEDLDPVFRDRLMHAFADMTDSW